MPILTVQVVLSKTNVPTGLVMVMFFQVLGGALAPSIGQNIFTDKLLRNLREVQGVDGEAVAAAGGRDSRAMVPPQLLGAVINTFNSALRNVFWVAAATPVIAWVVSWVMEWRKLPDSQKEITEAPAA
jgi:nitrate/nitrite transporter NarK